MKKKNMNNKGIKKLNLDFSQFSCWHTHRKFNCSAMVSAYFLFLHIFFQSVLECFRCNGNAATEDSKKKQRNFNGILFIIENHIIFSAFLVLFKWPKLEIFLNSFFFFNRYYSVPICVVFLLKNGYIKIIKSYKMYFIIYDGAT